MQKFHIKLFLLAGFCFSAPLFSEDALGKCSLRGPKDRSEILSIQEKKTCFKENFAVFLSAFPEDAYMSYGGLLALRDDFSGIAKRCSVAEEGVVLLAARHKGTIHLHIFLQPKVALAAKLSGTPPDESDEEAEVLLCDSDEMIYGFTSSESEISPFFDEKMSFFASKMGLPKPVDK